MLCICGEIEEQLCELGRNDENTCLGHEKEWNIISGVSSWMDYQQRVRKTCELRDGDGENG